ncbi:uncharacterized protein LOC133552626 isoform X2 [Nerophis ophidion]|uniref:uncharacterized protein LOC133552626 isoform X2 n=1 Tax=Nerophis ophidion TaxID=159077 RepID=UPI002AE06615|nr:uncharacterized protein LOC133552626 isoform X2 [Nerophis ophidion]
MDDRTSTPTTTSEVTRGQQNADLKASPSSKPLHRFLQKEPQSLGVAIGICGCAELIMGCVLFRETMTTSGKAYIPFWQGGLVTVCLSMYVMSILGVFVSSIYRIISFFFYWFVLWQFFADPMGYNRAMQLLALDCIMVTFSACVAVILIFLSVVARLALKSTNTQVIFQRISTPQTDTTSQL